ncbi:maleylpyruvate isomerase family mycothiol-dependent enzyme [Nonomuraea sp. K274]|uniref:Maleylpyruvate isomerase family mycothiol-dependent enzyme n=1 Tax=Nonomuraea cypriaca TaxID=1187855 RepID=A0A931F299_9ACTN|nr:maleylpyruvate isomerase family mycothiol-dependent enzyme [Nonomuraea cypriaca]MBF8192739.1 maleylpyruvate isomerase family mycothiol-dependent enzyme [Nonomuraea cypriaca]
MTARLVEGLREHTEGFARAVEGAGQDVQVVTCPEWGVRDLVGHIGQAHRWAAKLVREGEPLEVPDPRQEDPGRPEEWAGWLSAGAEELIAAVGEADPDKEVWSSVGPRPPAFWLRRMLNDTAVHHYDAAVTTGAAFAIADDLAADVITEGMELLSAPGVEAFKPELAELRGRGETLGLRPSSMTGWLVTRTPDGVRWERGRADADVVVSGTVAELMLVFSRRVPPGDVTGDRALLDHWLARTAF